MHNTRPLNYDLSHHADVNFDPSKYNDSGIVMNAAGFCRLRVCGSLRAAAASSRRWRSPPSASQCIELHLSNTDARTMRVIYFIIDIIYDYMYQERMSCALDVHI